MDHRRGPLETLGLLRVGMEPLEASKVCQRCLLVHGHVVTRDCRRLGMTCYFLLNTDTETSSRERQVMLDPASTSR